MDLNNLPTTDELDIFAPIVGSPEAEFQIELDRKRVWLRRIQGKPPWPTKEEAAALPALEMHPLVS